MGMFGTKLAPRQEAAFQQWRSRLPEGLQSTDDYDLRGAWQSNARAAANGHLPDTWKLPNHITFSDESVYNSPQTPGGHWSEGHDGRFVFWASPLNLRNAGGLGLADYFNRYEPDSSVILPIDYSLPRGTR